MGLVVEPEAHQSPNWSIPMLGAVPKQPFFRLEGLGLLQASRPGSTLVASSGSSPIVGTAMSGALGTASLALTYGSLDCGSLAAASAAMGHP